MGSRVRSLEFGCSGAKGFGRKIKASNVVSRTEGLFRVWV